MTVYTDNAHRFATRRNTALARATADHILTTACRKAADLLRDDAHRHQAAAVLADAERRAARLLNPQTAAAPTSTPGAAVEPDADPEGEAGRRPVNYLEARFR